MRCCLSEMAMMRCCSSNVDDDAVLCCHIMPVMLCVRPLMPVLLTCLAHDAHDDLWCYTIMPMLLSVKTMPILLFGLSDHAHDYLFWSC